MVSHETYWSTITDSNGAVEQELSYDAWGNLRDPDTWFRNWLNPAFEEPMFDRGFTGHEHLYTFGLINMNGRCYDPLTSHFLSVDAYVQDPSNAQAFNRYAYCAYNPLRYTDPTGWVYGSGPGNGVNPNLNTGGHSMYHSDDPNDVLWGRSVHPGGNSSSGYINGTAYTHAQYAQGNSSTSRQGGEGGFYDQFGNYLGSDKYKNDKVYVLCSETPEVMAMFDEIMAFFNGETTTLKWKDVYNCFVEIVPYQLSRKRMYDIVSKDDGTGGSAECNNMEYGGYIDDCFVMEVQHGNVKSPCVDQEINISFPTGMEYPTFHSHASGTGNCETYIGEDGSPYMPIWQQAPTKRDINIAGNHTCYVFGRRNDCVYVYTRQGVQSIIPTSVFISNSKFIKP